MSAKKVCSFEGCGKSQRCKGLCSAHYRQLRSGEELRPLVIRISSQKKYNESGQRWCPRCKKYEHVAKFPRDRSGSDGLAPYCKSCLRERVRVYKYGIDSEKYEAMLSEQEGRCALCKTDNPGMQGAWHIDHDHSCCPEDGKSCGKCVRKLLCSNCNTGLGLFKDNPELLTAAIVYLESHGKKSETSASS